jgi:hypothetical protein
LITLATFGRSKSSASRKTNQVGVISNEAGCRAEMNDWSCLRASLGECVYMSHDVMSRESLLLSCHFEVDVFEIRLHFGDLIVGDLQAEFLEFT